MQENEILSPSDMSKPELRTIITISVNREGQLVVAAPMTNKKLCMHALADALKVVADAPEAELAVPNVN